MNLSQDKKKFIKNDCKLFVRMVFESLKLVFKMYLLHDDDLIESFWSRVIIPNYLARMPAWYGSKRIKQKKYLYIWISLWNSTIFFSRKSASFRMRSIAVYLKKNALILCCECCTQKSSLPLKLSRSFSQFSLIMRDCSIFMCLTCQIRSRNLVESICENQLNK